MLIARFLRHARSARVAATALLLAGLAACSTPSAPGPAAPEPPQPPLHGAAVFAEGRLTAEVRLTAFANGRPERPPPGSTAGAPRRPRPEREGSFRGPPGGAGGGPPPDDGLAMPRGRPAGAAFNLPRQTLLVRFTNHGAEPLDFEITDLRSLVGNFSPRPQRLRLAPGDSAELEPVSGDAGGVLLALDLTLAVRVQHRPQTAVLHLAPESP